MFGVTPIPLWMLGDSMLVSVPDGHGGFSGPVEVSPVRFEEVQSASDEAHRSADAGGGTVFVDAVNSRGAFEVPVGSRVEIGGVSYFVRKCKRRGEFGPRVHHWELVVT